MEKLILIWLNTAVGGDAISFATNRTSINFPGMATAKPIWSFPLRPALPVIWWNSVAVSGLNSMPLNLSELRNTMERAGKFTPAATVEVANTASRSPSVIKFSSTSFQAGNCPLWWEPTADFSSRVLCRCLAMCGFCPTRSLIRLLSINWRFWSCRRFPSQSSSAWSQSARDLRKKSAGRSRYFFNTRRMSPKGGRFRGNAITGGDLLFK